MRFDQYANRTVPGREACARVGFVNARGIAHRTSSPQSSALVLRRSGLGSE